MKLVERKKWWMICSAYSSSTLVKNIYYGFCLLHESEEESWKQILSCGLFAKERKNHGIFVVHEMY